MIELSLPLEENNGQIKIPCIFCGGDWENTHHIAPCDKGWVWVRKDWYLNILKQQEKNLKDGL